jgi:hypothetical protein
MMICLAASEYQMIQIKQTIFGLFNDYSMIYYCFFDGLFCDVMKYLMYAFDYLMII